MTRFFKLPTKRLFAHPLIVTGLLLLAVVTWLGWNTIGLLFDSELPADVLSARKLRVSQDQLLQTQNQLERYRTAQSPGALTVTFAP